MPWAPLRPGEASDESEAITCRGGCSKMSASGATSGLLSTRRTGTSICSILIPRITPWSPPSRRDILCDEIRLRINARPERRIRKHYLNILNIARRAAD